MKATLLRYLAVGLIFALLLGACAQPAGEAPVAEEPAEVEPAPDEPAEPEMEEILVTVGFTSSITGKYEVSSAAQVNGFKMWMDRVNSAGGLQLGDSTVVKFDFVTYDDESNAERVQELYTRLTTEDNADFLISPYSSGLTAAAAVIAEQYATPMITTGAASDATYQQGYTHVFQAYTPASRYLTGAVDLLANTDPSVTRIAFVYENDKFSTDVVTAAKDYAESLGYEVVLFEGYDSETADFAPFINKIEAAAPEAIFGGGHRVDGKAFAKQLYEKGVDVKMFALLVAPPEPEFAELGEAAFGVIGPSQWEPLAAFTPESAAEVGADWLGPTGDEFVSGFEGSYNAEPSYHAAGGYVAGLMLEKAILDAGSVDPEDLMPALEGMNLMTFYGQVSFDTTPENHGLQVGHSMVYIQWQKDEAGNLVKQVVWPLAGATSEPIYPLR